MSVSAQPVGVKGIGWVNGAEYGSVIRPRRVRYGDGVALAPWKQAELFKVPPKNAGRFDAATRMILSACALAIQDAGGILGDGEKHPIGLLGTNVNGCVGANRAYFKDYLAGGRVLARANLFVYTLPSSPLADAAIHFGLQGPVLYIGFGGSGAGSIRGLLDIATGYLAEGIASGMVVVVGDECSAVAVWLGYGDGVVGVEKLKACFERGEIWTEGNNL